MTSQVMIEDSLVEEARKIGRHDTTEDAVRCALREYIARHKRLRIVELFGTIEYDDDYDYKAVRRKDQP